MTPGITWPCGASRGRPRHRPSPPSPDPWLARLSGLDAFWAFAVVTIVGLAVAGVLLWAVVLRERTPRQAWLALGLFVVSPAAVYALADHYLVDPVAYAFLSLTGCCSCCTATG